MPIALTLSLLAGALNLLYSSKTVPYPTPLAQTQGDAHQPARQLLQRAHSMRCSFDKGTTTFLDSLSNSQPDRLPGIFVFDNIDRSTNRARLIVTGGVATDASASDVTVIPAATSETLSFLERAPLGDGLYIVFAAFAPGRKSAALLAVSYGYATLPRPNVGTFYGSCRVLE